MNVSGKCSREHEGLSSIYRIAPGHVPHVSADAGAGTWPGGFGERGFMVSAVQARKGEVVDCMVLGSPRTRQTRT